MDPSLKSNIKKTVLPPDLLLELYNLFIKKDPLPYSYVQIPGKRNLSKHTHIKCYVNEGITCVSRDVMKHSGIYETADPGDWNCSLGFPFDIDKYTEFEPWQKVNHFCGDFLIGKKSELDYRMEELLPLYPELSNFYPLTFSFPRQKTEFDSSISSRRYWIIKPNHSMCGKYITIYDSTTPITSLQIDFTEFRGVIQEYIERPLTLFGRKFDLRLYVLVTSLRPLKIFLNTQGLARFCPQKYSMENFESNRHLTNFTLHKDDSDFVFSRNSRSESVKNCKWSLRFFLSFLALQLKVDVSRIVRQIEEIVITTLISACTSIRILQESRTKHRKLCFELFGFDVLIDDDFRCHLLEVNMNPNMSGHPSLLDHEMKRSVIEDVLRLAKIVDIDTRSAKSKEKVADYEKKFIESVSFERRKAVELKKLNPWDEPVFADFEIVRDLIDELVRKKSSVKKSASLSDYFCIEDLLAVSKCRAVENDEDFCGTFSEEGNFRLIFPTPENVELYSRCFGVMRYEDVVLQKWIVMDDEEKMRIIKSHLLGFESPY